MKIILSRKGFDSGTGKVASPIFPSGAMCSLPIPELTAAKHTMSYGTVTYDGHSLGDIVAGLTGGRIGPGSPVHLDPDLRCESLDRAPGWKPLFGQAEAAESHLRLQGVSEGDVFLFFGWFRRVEKIDGRYKYVKDAPDQHVIFGWFQIERRIPVLQRAEIPAWALYHPHCQGIPYNKNDSLYVSTNQLSLPQVTRPGAGVFQRFREDLCLTAPNETRSQWRLQGWFDPHNGRPPLTYHGRMSLWTPGEAYVDLDSAKQGQEFVLDCDKYPEAIDWLANLLMLAE